MKLKLCLAIALGVAISLSRGTEPNVPSAIAGLSRYPTSEIHSSLSPSPPVKEEWDYSSAMRDVAARFTGRQGVVIHIGDSLTYASGYGAWARSGQGKSPEDEAICRWMHTNANDDTDGWHLAAVDLPDGRSETAVSGIRLDQFLSGGKAGIPPMSEVVRKYKPSIVVLMLGTNDVLVKRSADDYQRDMRHALDIILQNNAIPILSTIPPNPTDEMLARAYNERLRELAQEKLIPLIDYEREILNRRPTDWNGTLLSRDSLHPTASHGGATPTSEPTDEHLKNSGYLLRGWLSVKKIAEVKSRVIDVVAKQPQ